METTAARSQGTLPAKTSVSRPMIESRNPTTGALIQTFNALDERALQDRVARAASAFRAWRSTSFRERAARMNEVARRLDADAERFGRLMTLEMGKPVGAGRDEAL